MLCVSDGKKLGFSLIELLVVMAVMASLMGLLTPTVANISKSGNLNSGGNLVANLIASARQNAISKNALTALVIASDTTKDSQNRMFTVLEMLPPADGVAALAPTDWKQISKWEKLDSGIVVETVSLASTPPVAFPALHYGGETIASDQLKSVIFMPDGSMDYSDAPTVIKIVEGFMKGGTVHYTGKLNGGMPANYYQITILNVTGRVKIDRP